MTNISACRGPIGSAMSARSSVIMPYEISGKDRDSLDPLEVGEIFHIGVLVGRTGCRGCPRPADRLSYCFSGKSVKRVKLLEVARKLHMVFSCGKSACGVPRRAAQRKTPTLYYTTNGTRLSRGFCKKKESFLALFFIAPSFSGS